MYVKDITLINYRNYFNLNLKLNRGVNVFIGKNAQGKTNLLESIYICAMGKSFRTNRDRELIHFEKKQAYVAANVNTGNYNRFIEIKLDEEGPKRIKVNRTEIENHRELYSGLNIVVFSPDDLKLVKEGPAERRRFLDEEISQIRPVYKYNLGRYNKVLYQRNNLLKSSKFRSNLGALLDVFDLQLAKLGSKIVLERERYLQALSEKTKLVHQDLTKELEELELIYSTNIEIVYDEEEMEARYYKLLKSKIDNDIDSRSTSIGPHRDDLIMNVNGMNVKTFGSQGQQRTVVLSIKLAEVQLIKNEKGFYPVLLLDDVFSELDAERREYLVKSFKDMQTIITGTDVLDLIDLENLDKSIFYIEGGFLKEGVGSALWFFTLGMTSMYTRKTS